jgi:two-component system, OmpR family, sensor histidine kinase KdpD
MRAWAGVVALLALATAGGFVLDHHVSLTSQAMLYVLTVVIASYRLPFVPSVVCALGSVTAFNFFFVPPRWTFAVDNQEHLIALFTMLVVALVIHHLANHLRKEAALAQLNAYRARQLQELASALTLTTSRAEVAALGQRALQAAFKGPLVLALRLTTHPDDDNLDLPADGATQVRDGLQSCMREVAVLGPGTGRWPGLNAWYLPLGTKGQMQGAVCIHSVTAADDAGREHAQALCALIAQTLLRLQMTAAVIDAQAETQRQQVQGTFLAAISHDLRTPLAALVGAATSLQTQGDKLSAADQQRLLDSIVSEATYLSSVTENTLQLVQLTNASQDIRRSWEAMEEIVGAVLARTRTRDPAHRIQSKVPHDLPLIQADPVLLAQLVSNLLDNALKYSTGSIDLVVSVTLHTMEVAVKDRGPDIPADRQQAIFEPYARNDQSGQRGAGLGLALCRAIAQAHKGTLGLRRRNRGGNVFVLSLPLAAEQPAGDTP